ALNLPPSYYESMAAQYLERRDLMLDLLAGLGLPVSPPRGAYYVMADIGHLGFANDVEAARHLVRDAGVATVPGSSFYSRPELGRNKIRFSFCKRLGTLREAGERLSKKLAVSASQQPAR